MSPALLAVVFLAACCAPAPTPIPVADTTANAIPAPVPPPRVAPVAAVPDIRAPGSPAIDHLTPAQIGTAATQARTDANDYVAWRASKPDNIDRMAILVKALNASVATMRAHEVNGKYPTVDVMDAREKLRDLRLFLSQKDDSP